MAETMNEVTTTVKAKEGLYLTFGLDREVYGIEILTVQEIIGIIAVTSIPKTPDFVRGVINLRGQIIPVIDLRLKFGMTEIDDTERTCIIVVGVVSAGRAVTTGIIVDEVAEVTDISSDRIEPAPTFGTTVTTDFILGMGKVGDKVIMLLDAEKILAGDEITALEKIAVAST